MSDYHAQFEEALQEATMLLHIHHPTERIPTLGHVAHEGDLPPCGMLDGVVGQLREAVGPLVLTYIAQGAPVGEASYLALESVLRSALEVGFATGRVFQSHGFNVPTGVA